MVCKRTKHPSHKKTSNFTSVYLNFCIHAMQNVSIFKTNYVMCSQARSRTVHYIFEGVAGGAQ